jgi:hypothetical protein
VKRFVVLALASLSLLAGCGGGKPATGRFEAPSAGPTTAGRYDESALHAGGLDKTEGLSNAGQGAGGGPTAGSARPSNTGGKSSPFASAGAEVVRTAVPVADYPTLFAQAIAAKYRPVWLDGYDSGTAAFYDVVFRKDNGSTPWFEYTEMSASGYQSRFDALKDQGYQLTFVESYLNAGQVRYAAIWEKTAAVASFGFHGYSASAYQSMLDNKTKAGLLPAQVSVVTIGSTLSYSGLLIKRSLGASWTLKADLTEAAYQQLFDQQTKAGQGLAYVNAYIVGGAPRFVALFAASAKTPFQAKHGMSAAAFTSQTSTLTKQGYSTRAVCGYVVNGSTSFIALWSK